MSLSPRDQNSNAFEHIAFGDKASSGAGNVAEIMARLSRLEATATSGGTTVGAIQNLLRNSDFSYSQLKYDGTGTDDDVYGWARGAVPTDRITPSSAGVRWDKVNGGLKVVAGGLAHDISYQFSKRIVLPGQTYFLMFLAKLETPANLAGAQLEYGFWDSSPGINNWVTASVVGSSTSAAPTITVVGTPATTTYGYQVAAILADGTVIVSAVATTTTGNATLNATNYNAIAWAAVPGVVRYDVYRTVGGTVGLIASIASGATSWNDQGATVQAGAGVPVSTASQARNTWADIGTSLSAEDWASFRFQIDVPSAYSLAQTQTGQQWLRVGFRNLPAGAPPILVDRFGLSYAAGEWSPAADDADAVGDISTAPTSDGGKKQVRIIQVGWKWLRILV